MGRSSRQKPARLAEKLLHIRTALGLSQNELISRLGLTEELFRQDISDYERDVREPSLMTLLAYARVVGISTDVLIDDVMNLPNKLLKAARLVGVKCKSTGRTKNKR